MLHALTAAQVATKTATKMSDTITNALDQAASQTTGFLGSPNGPKVVAAIKNSIQKI
jgi:hypothetical protein